MDSPGSVPSDMGERPEPCPIDSDRYAVAVDSWRHIGVLAVRGEPIEHETPQCVAHCQRSVPVDGTVEPDPQKLRLFQAGLNRLLAR